VSVFCSDSTWSEFQRVAAQAGNTVADYLGEIVENVVTRSRADGDEQERLPEALQEKRQESRGAALESRGAALPPRVLIGFGKPVIRVR
jgi:hypothetical protein